MLANICREKVDEIRMNKNFKVIESLWLLKDTYLYIDVLKSDKLPDRDHDASSGALYWDQKDTL
jgi:hypothetical protein